MKSLFVLASSLASANALPTRFKSGLDTNLDSIKSNHDYYLDQKLDHFDRSNKEVFGQRYFVNDTYWNGEGPVFLCVGGEGPPLTWKVLVASDHCNDMVELAPQVGALLLAIEHRYYGPSTPNDDYTSENLRFLSSEQALGDIAHFHAKMSDEFKLSDANKWVSFGGSYPGMMAAMARLRYPHLFHAAVSSSSPMLAAVDMPGYNEVVAESMANEGVGGSQQCLEVIAEGHRAVGDLLASESGRRELETLFNICTPGALDNEANAEQFAGDGVVYLPVQSNDPVCKGPHCNIEKICQLMTDSSVGTPLDRLIALHQDQSGGACTPANHELYLRAISNPKDSGRSWYYQTCTEWGYYMTCPVGSKCPYVQGLHKLSSDYEMCSRAFGMDQATVDESIAFANDMYGGVDIQGTRIMYPNGEIDPWHANGVLVPPNDESPVLNVIGASHHSWTHAAEETDTEEVVAAKHAIWDQVTAWLKEE